MAYQPPGTRAGKIAASQRFLVMTEVNVDRFLSLWPKADTKTLVDEFGPPHWSVPQGKDPETFVKVALEAYWKHLLHLARRSKERRKPTAGSDRMVTKMLKQTTARKLAAWLVTASTPFRVEPLPEDLYAVTMKERLYEHWLRNKDAARR